MSDIAGREFGDVLVAFVDVPPNGPRLAIAPAAPRVAITVALLALVDAGESPWAEIRGWGPGGGDDPYAYKGSLLRVRADGRTVVYRIGEYLPSLRCYVADLQEEPERQPITS